MHKKVILVILIMAAFTLTGCWDSVEIDERAIVLALGIDLHQPTEEEAAINQEMLQISPSHPLVLSTFVYPKQQKGIGGEGELTNINISSISQSVFGSRRQLATRTDNELFLGHLKVILLGEDAARNEKLFREVLDGGEKEPLISRRAALAIAEGTAKDLLDVESKLEPITGQYLTDLFGGRDRTQRTPVLDFGEILISLHQNRSAVIPRLVPNKDEIKLGGAAVIKDYVMVGWLGELESLAINIITGKARGFGLNTEVGEILIPYNITQAGVKLSIVNNGNQIKMIVSLEGEGDIQALYFDSPEDVLDPAFLEKVEKSIEEDIKLILSKTIEKVQDFEADVVGFDQHIKKREPKLWEEIEKDWPTIFPDLEVVVEVEIFMRRVGLSK